MFRDSISAGFARGVATGSSLPLWVDAAITLVVFGAFAWIGLLFIRGVFRWLTK